MSSPADSSPPAGSFARDAHAIVDVLDAYYRESVSGRPRVIHQERLAWIVEHLDLAALVREGGLAGSRLETFVDDYLQTTTRLHHPAFLAHQVAAPHPTGSLASLIDGFTNNAMAIYEMGPGAASIEFFVVNWMLEKIGWRPAPLEGDAEGPVGSAGIVAAFSQGASRGTDRRPVGGGVLTHGGSLANLTALLAARRRAAPDSWRTGAPRDLVLFAPTVSHYSIARAAGILGLGQEAVWPLEVDGRGAIVAARLPAALAAARAAGKRPLAVVANACNTPVGIYDPLQEIGEFCRAHDIWLHVDGAHGASALVSPTHRHLLRGIELADSLTWDAHKMLRAPTLCAGAAGPRPSDPGRRLSAGGELPLPREGAARGGLRPAHGGVHQGGPGLEGVHGARRDGRTGPRGLHRPGARADPAGVRVPPRPARHGVRRPPREHHPVLPRRRQRCQAAAHPGRAERRGQLLPVVDRVRGPPIPAHGGDQPRDLARRHRAVRRAGS